MGRLGTVLRACNGSEPDQVTRTRCFEHVAPKTSRNLIAPPQNLEKILSLGLLVSASVLRQLLPMEWKTAPMCSRTPKPLNP